MKRFWLALVISPLWVPVASAIIAFYLFQPGEIKSDRWEFFITLIGFVTLGAYLGMLFLGYPMHRKLLQKDSLSAKAYGVAFFMNGLLIWSLVQFLSLAQIGILYALRELVSTLFREPLVPISLGCIWAMVGFTFWRIARPDLGASKKHVSE